MLSNSEILSRYLEQYRELYGNQLLFDAQADNSQIQKLGDSKSSLIKCPKCELEKVDISLDINNSNTDIKVVFVGMVSINVEKLFDKILTAINLPKKNIYLFNELSTTKYKYCFNQSKFCELCISKQLLTIKPNLIVILGMELAVRIIDISDSFANIRNKIFNYHGLDLVITLGLESLIKNPNNKVLAWKDFKMIRNKYLLVN